LLLEKPVDEDYFEDKIGVSDNELNDCNNA
jgi:hypothetical protein